MKVTIQGTIRDGSGFTNCSIEIHLLGDAVEIKPDRESEYDHLSFMFDTAALEHAINAAKTAPERKFKGVEE